MIYDKKIKIFSIIGLSFIIVFCSIRPSFAEDLSNNWEYTYTNFNDIFLKDIESVACSVYGAINTEFGDSNATNWDTLINDRYFERSYFYIAETDTTGNTFKVYIYLPNTQITQGVCNYYKWQNFPSYTGVQVAYLLTVYKGSNPGGNSLTYTSPSSMTFDMPAIFYGYSTNLLVQAVRDNGTSNIEDVVSSKLDKQINVILDLKGSVDKNTEKQDELNKWFMDENVTSDVNLPENGLSSSTANSNVNGFFSRVCDLLSSSFSYSDNHFSGRQISIGSHSETINSDYTRVLLNNFLGSSANSVIVNLVGGFWFFLIVWFVYNDIRKEIDKVSNFTFTNDSMDTDLL